MKREALGIVVAALLLGALAAAETIPEIEANLSPDVEGALLAEGVRLLSYVGLDLSYDTNVYSVDKDAAEEESALIIALVPGACLNWESPNGSKAEVKAQLRGLKYFAEDSRDNNDLDTLEAQLTAGADLLLGPRYSFQATNSFGRLADPYDPGWNLRGERYMDQLELAVKGAFNGWGFVAGPVFGFTCYTDEDLEYLNHFLYGAKLEPYYELSPRLQGFAQLNGRFYRYTAERGRHEPRLFDKDIYELLVGAHYQQEGQLEVRGGLGYSRISVDETDSLVPHDQDSGASLVLFGRLSLVTEAHEISKLSAALERRYELSYRVNYALVTTVRVGFQRRFGERFAGFIGGGPSWVERSVRDQSLTWLQFRFQADYQALRFLRAYVRLDYISQEVESERAFEGFERMRLGAGAVYTF